MRDPIALAVADSTMIRRVAASAAVKTSPHQTTRAVNLASFTRQQAAVLDLALSGETRGSAYVSRNPASGNGWNPWLAC